MADQPSTRGDRIDTLARLVNTGFNGDRGPGDQVAFVLVAWERDGTQEHYSVINNNVPDHLVKRALIVALDQVGQVAGHA